MVFSTQHNEHYSQFSSFSKNFPFQVLEQMQRRSQNEVAGYYFTQSQLFLLFLVLNHSFLLGFLSFCSAQNSQKQTQVYTGDMSFPTYNIHGFIIPYYCIIQFVNIFHHF
jgi:hypothetical protein